MYKTTDEEVANIIHEVNRVLCEHNDDHSQVSWAEAPEWMKQSVIDAVRFHRENPFAGCDVSHDNWCEAKKADGWVYGPIKSIEEKTHPCLVPYDELPENQKLKDKTLVAIVHASP